MFSKTALIVDDSLTAQAVLKRLLVQNGYLVDTQRSGEDALSHIKTKVPDVIFLDHIMPGLDGFQTLKHIKANPKTQSIPVVMYTSQTAEKYSNEAKALGAIGVLSKQLSNNELDQLLDQVSVQIQPEVPDVIVTEESLGFDISSVEAENDEDQWPDQQWKKLLHSELAEHKQDLERQHRDLMLRIEKMSLNTSHMPLPPTKPAIVKFMAFGLALLIPTLVSFDFYGRVQQQQQQINSLLQTVTNQNHRLADANKSMAANVQLQRQQATEERDDMIFLLETLIATIDQQPAKLNPSSSKPTIPAKESVSEPQEQQPPLSLALDNNP